MKCFQYAPRVVAPAAACMTGSVKEVVIRAASVFQIWHACWECYWQTFWGTVYACLGEKRGRRYREALRWGIFVVLCFVLYPTRKTVALIVLVAFAIATIPSKTNDVP